ADRERQRVLRDPAERSAYDDARDDHEDHGGDGPGHRERDAPLRAAEREDDERDLEALEQHALERDGEPVPIDAPALLMLAGASPVWGARRRVAPRRCAASASGGAPRPLARGTPWGSHCSRKTSSSDPPTSRRTSIGRTVSAGPSAATITARASEAANVPARA